MEINPKSRMLWSYSKDIDKEKFNWAVESFEKK